MGHAVVVPCLQKREYHEAVGVSEEELERYRFMCQASESPGGSSLSPPSSPPTKRSRVVSADKNKRSLLEGSDACLLCLCVSLDPFTVTRDIRFFPRPFSKLFPALF